MPRISPSCMPGESPQDRPSSPQQAQYQPIHSMHNEQQQQGRVDLDDTDSFMMPPAQQQLCHWTIYAVHALCAWDERLYEFASYLFLFEIFKATLLPSSIYGFMTTVAGILFSTFIGTIVDRTPRLQAVQTFLLTQKIGGMLGGLGFWALLTYFDPTDTIHHSSTMSAEMGYSIFSLLVLLSGLLKLSALGWSISIERDWIVVLCQGDSPLLTRINATMKRIDLVCKLSSPLAVAACLAWWPMQQVSLLIAAWSIVSLALEWLLVLRIWHRSPALWEPREVVVGVGHYAAIASAGFPARKQTRVHHRMSQGDSTANDSAVACCDHPAAPLAPSLSATNFSPTPQRDPEEQRQMRRSRHQNTFRYIFMSFGAYWHHAVFFASLSYGIIYINLMSVSGTMIGYLKWRGFTPSVIALLKGVCTAAELLGTIAMPVLTYYVGLVRAGSWSIWFEVLALTPVMLAIYADRLPIQVIIFVGMALSRIGVWSFDLVITQIMQEHIDNDGAGAINGWHYTAMNTFELAQFLLTMIWYDPEQYIIPALISYMCVVAGAVVYTGYLLRMRGHLFHYQQLATSEPPAFLSPHPETNEPDQLEH